MKSESRNAEGTWYEGTWNDWCWRTPDHWSSSSSLTPQAYSWTWHNWEHHAPLSNQGSPQWNSPVDTTSSDPRQCGDGRGEVIPTFDGVDFRQYERRVRLFVSNTRVAPERRAGKLFERLEGRALDSCEGIQDLETPNGVENLLDHLRIHFELIEAFRQGIVVDDFVSMFSSVSQARKSRSTSHRETPCSRRFLKLALCEGVFPCVENSQERTRPKW